MGRYHRLTLGHEAVPLGEVGGLVAGQRATGQTFVGACAFGRVIVRICKGSNCPGNPQCQLSGQCHCVDQTRIERDHLGMDRIKGPAYLPFWSDPALAERPCGID